MKIFKREESETLDATITFRCTTAEREDLLDAAAMSGMSLSMYVLMLIREGLT